MRRALLLLAASVGLAPSAAMANDWVDTIFPERRFDFGTVAKGSKLRHTFRLVNTTNADLHIASWQAKCGCTEIKVGSRDVPPGTQTVIEATIDTTKFVGYKPSGLTIYFDRPQFRQVDLDLTCFIRADVVLAPGGIDFGVVARGSKPSVTLNLTYAGGLPDWGVMKVHTISDGVSAQVREVGRSGGSAQYEIVATLSPTAPSGYFKDEVTLVTNDPSSPRIPISVAANVQNAVSVLPSILNLGPIKAGQAVTKDILVRSSRPFRVTGVNTKAEGVSTNQGSQAQAPLHKVTVTLKAPSRPGPFNAVLEILTDIKDEPPARLTAFATIVP